MLFLIWSQIFTKLFGLPCQHSPTYIYWLGFTHSSGERVDYCVYFLYVIFPLLIYQMLFFGRVNGLSYLCVISVWVKVTIIFFYIWLIKTYGSRLDFVLVDKYWFYYCKTELNKNWHAWYNKLWYMDENLYAGT